MVIVFVGRTVRLTTGTLPPDARDADTGFKGEPEGSAWAHMLYT
jgi:hypothetical protein